MKAKLLLTDGREIEIEPSNGETFELEEMYGILKCDLIEIVTLVNSEDILVIDEEGKFKPDNQINERATRIAVKHYGIIPSDVIVGNANPLPHEYGRVTEVQSPKTTENYGKNNL